MTTAPTRWLTAEQLGPHFDDGGPVILVENHAVFRRRPTHRQKAHLYLAALRHRARSGGDRVALVSADSRRGSARRFCPTAAS